jgi:hypothetical protein
MTRGRDWNEATLSENPAVEQLLLAGMRNRGNSVKFAGEVRASSAVNFTGDGGL